jgi:hypothetical protein
MALDVSGGKTAKVMLRPIVDECWGKDISDEFYARFFNLFKLVNPHQRWMTEKEFDQHKGYYGKTYVGYQAAKVRKLIY